MTKDEIKIISYNLSNCTYHGNLEATEQLIDLFNKITRRPLKTPEDYINMYNWNFYTYHTWEALVKSEEEQNNGLTEAECHAEFGKTIWKLPCGWYVQYV